MQFWALQSLDPYPTDRFMKTKDRDSQISIDFGHMFGYHPIQSLNRQTSTRITRAAEGFFRMLIGFMSSFPRNFHEFWASTWPGLAVRASKSWVSTRSAGMTGPCCFSDHRHARLVSRLGVLIRMWSRREQCHNPLELGALGVELPGFLPQRGGCFASPPA